MGGLAPDSAPYSPSEHRKKAGKLPQHLWVRVGR